MGFSKYVSKNVGEIDFYPVGIASVDVSLGGGIAVGRLIELVGAEGVGKTSLALRLASSRIITKDDTYLLFLDAEQALSFERIHQIWLDDENVEIDHEKGTINYMGQERGMVIPVETYEETLKTIKDFIRFCTEEKKEGVIIWDSMVSLVSESIMKDGSEGKAYRARWIQDILMYLKAFMYKLPITLIAINQIRAKMDFGFGSSKSEGIMSGIDYEIAGGKAHKFLSFQTVFIQKHTQFQEYTKQEPKLIGIKTKFNVIKNKLYTPNKNTDENVILFEVGYNNVLSSIEYLKKRNLVKGKGYSSIKLIGLNEDKGMSLEALCERIANDDEFRRGFISLTYGTYASTLGVKNRLEKILSKYDEIDKLVKYDALKLMRYLENVSS